MDAGIYCKILHGGHALMFWEGNRLVNAFFNTNAIQEDIKMATLKWHIYA